ncbi:MAG TPA: dihydropteroate synthase [Rhodoglobus sp.]|nr:dihydropteroate synthase [Rhodoglobus sp.]
MTKSTAPQIIGVLNVTPDSFSDGGRFEDAAAAVRAGVALHEEGADLVDVGGESTRPGAEPVGVEEEQARVLPVIRELTAAGVPVSIDTMHAETALAAVQAGAVVINDVSGGLADPGMYRVAATSGVLYIASHWRGPAETEVRYDDVVAEVRQDLKARLAEMIVSGMSPDQVILDPGIGFAKRSKHNWTLLGHLPQLSTLGHPLVIGVSRKRFLGRLLASDAAVDERDLPTAVISALAASAGVWGVRVHDVPSTRIALAAWQSWQDGAR